MGTLSFRVSHFSPQCTLLQEKATGTLPPITLDRAWLRVVSLAFVVSSCCRARGAAVVQPRFELLPTPDSSFICVIPTIQRHTRAVLVVRKHVLVWHGACGLENAPAQIPVRPRSATQKRLDFRKHELTGVKLW